MNTGNVSDLMKPALMKPATILPVCATHADKQSFIVLYCKYLILIIASLTLTIAFIAKPVTAQTIVTTIDLGSGDFPFGVGVNPTTNLIYVANANNDNVSVIDGSTNSVIKTVSVGESPALVGVNPATNLIYVSNFFSDNVSIIDGFTNSVIKTVSVEDGGPSRSRRKPHNQPYLCV